MAQRFIRIAIALERCRRDTGQFPQELKALLPLFIDDIPIDRFSNLPLSYRPTEDGYVLYSVGYNAIEDGGHSSDASAAGDDIVVRMSIAQ